MEPKIIAEIKKGSPKAGIINQNIDAAFYTKEYERLGAKVISVVTSDKYFGEDKWVTTVRENTKLPILRKDFIHTMDDLKKTKDLGADWVLIIAELLTYKELDSLIFDAEQLGLKPIVEVHSTYGVSNFARSNSSRTVLINNRNLRTGELDFQASRVIVPTVPIDFEIIVASGIDVNLDFMNEIRAFNCVDYVLIGTLFMKSNNLEETFKSLCKTSSTSSVQV